ncbi:hypothetical protein PFISCL1PPCAC_19881, partial [Pristionchus fissidentatus]
TRIREAKAAHSIQFMSTINTPSIKLYVTSITANTEVRKQVQRAVMILEGLRIPFLAIDITKPGMEEERAFMKEKAVNIRNNGPPLPPQFFIDNNYVGNYLDFEESVEEDKLEEFLQLTAVVESVNAKTTEKTAIGETEDGDAGDEEEEGEEG